MSMDQFVFDEICHPYNFSEENPEGRFGRVFNDVPYAFHPLLNPPKMALSKHEWQHDKFLGTMLLSPPIAEEKGGSYRRQLRNISATQRLEKPRECLHET